MSTQGAEPSGEQAEFASPAHVWIPRAALLLGGPHAVMWPEPEFDWQPGGSARGAAAAGVAGPGVVPQLLLCAGAVLGRDMGYLNPILCGFPWRRGML